MSDDSTPISRTWNTWNTAFRRGFAAYGQRKMQTGNPDGTCSERGFWHGWIWCRDGNRLPSDPMMTVLLTKRK